MKKVSAGAAVVICTFVVVGLWMIWPKERLKSPDEIVLRSTEVPPEWRANVLEIPYPLENVARAFGISVDNLRRWGYEAGFARVFSTADWESRIDSFAARFSSVSGAKEMFTLMPNIIATKDPRASEVAIWQEIGDEAWGFKTIEKETSWRIFFRRANFFAGLKIVGPTGTFALDNVVTYAQIIDSRIK